MFETRQLPKGGNKCVLSLEQCLTTGHQLLFLLYLPILDKIHGGKS